MNVCARLDRFVAQEKNVRPYERRLLRIFVNFLAANLTRSLPSILGLSHSGATTLGIMTLSIMTLSITTLGIMTLSITLKKRDTQCNDTQNKKKT
jgi:hypothetical protein